MKVTTTYHLILGSALPADMFLFDMLALPEGVVVYLIIELALARAWWGFQALFGFFGLRVDLRT